MDFKKFFKNKFVIAIIINLVLIAISASLTAINSVFYGITSLLSCVFCFIIALMYFVKYNQLNNNVNTDLVPLTEAEENKVNKEIKRNKRFNIIKIITFVVLGLTFFVLAFQMF